MSGTITATRSSPTEQVFRDFLLRAGRDVFTYAGARRELQSVSPGNYPKFASLEVVRSPQFRRLAGRLHHLRLPRASRGAFQIQRGRRRFSNEGNARPAALDNVTFRPIDVKFGPTARFTSPTGRTRSFSTARWIFAIRAATKNMAVSGGLSPNPKSEIRNPKS